jgi:DNA-binding NarL/FixJ family response regulator
MISSNLPPKKDAAAITLGAAVCGIVANSATLNQRTLQILIADDHPMIRKRVRTVLEGHLRFDVCAEVADGAEAIAQAIRLTPDVVVLNITMPVLSGLEAAREIRGWLPECAIVILSSHADEQFIEEAKKVGAQAYVAKTKIGEALIKAIGDAVDSPNFVVVS